MPGLIFVVDYEGSETTDAVLELLEPLAYEKGFVTMTATDAGDDARAWLEASVGVLHIPAEVRDRGGDRDKWERVISDEPKGGRRRKRAARRKRSLWDEAKRAAPDRLCFEVSGRMSPDETEDAFSAWLDSVSRRPFA